MFCLKCEEKNDDSVMKCKFCGESFEDYNIEGFQFEIGTNNSFMYVDCETVIIVEDGKLVASNRDATQRVVLDSDVYSVFSDDILCNVVYVKNDGTVYGCDIYDRAIKTISSYKTHPSKPKVAFNEEYMFVIAPSNDKENFLVKISFDFEEIEVMLRSDKLLDVGLEATDDFVYFATKGEDNCERISSINLENNEYKSLVKCKFIKGFVVYKGILYYSYLKQRAVADFLESGYIERYSIKENKIKSLASANAVDLSIYFNYLFYKDITSKKIWCVSLFTGEKHLVTVNSAERFSIASGMLMHEEVATKEYELIQIADINEGEPLIDTESVAVRKLKYNPIIGDFKNFNSKNVVEDALDFAFSNYTFGSEFLDYVVSFTNVDFNLKNENFEQLLKAGKFTDYGDNKPLFFVGSGIFNKRSKGFIIATDGIHSKKGRMPYKQCMEMEEGFQALKVNVYKTEEMYDIKQKYEFECPMIKQNLSDLAFLVQAIYILIYYGVSDKKFMVDIPKHRDRNRDLFVDINVD